MTRKSNCLCAQHARTEGVGQPGQAGTVPGQSHHAHRDRSRDSGTSPLRGVSSPAPRYIVGPSRGVPLGGTQSPISKIYAGKIWTIARRKRQSDLSYWNKAVSAVASPLRCQRPRHTRIAPGGAPLGRIGGIR